MGKLVTSKTYVAPIFPLTAGRLSLFSLILGMISDKTDYTMFAEQILSLGSSKSAWAVVHLGLSRSALELLRTLLRNEWIIVDRIDPLQS